MTKPHDRDPGVDGTHPVGTGGPPDDAGADGAGVDGAGVDGAGVDRTALAGADEQALENESYEDGGDEELDARDRAVLAMEGQGWPGPGAKERAIRERLGLSPTRYYQLLNALLDDPAAARHAPVTVNRLRRVREAQRRRR